MQAHPGFLTHQAILGEEQKDLPPNMEHIQVILMQYQLTVPAKFQKRYAHL